MEVRRSEKDRFGGHGYDVTVGKTTFRVNGMPKPSAARSSPSAKGEEEYDRQQGDMNKKLTPEQKAMYLLNPNECPFCGSDDISGGDSDVDTFHWYVTVSCNEEACARQWVEKYELVEIQDIDG